jgi:hypothetical protein
LIKALEGSLPLWGGKRKVGDGVKISYFSQDLAQDLPLEMTALQYVEDMARKFDSSMTLEKCRGALGALGIQNSMALTKIGEHTDTGVVRVAGGLGRGAGGVVRVAGGVVRVAGGVVRGAGRVVRSALGTLGIQNSMALSKIGEHKNTFVDFFYIKNSNPTRTCWRSSGVHLEHWESISVWH